MPILTYKVYGICQNKYIIILEKCFIDNALSHQPIDVWGTSQSQKGYRFGSWL